MQHRNRQNYKDTPEIFFLSFCLAPRNTATGKIENVSLKIIILDGDDDLNLSKALISLEIVKLKITEKKNKFCTFNIWIFIERFQFTIVTPVWPVHNWCIINIKQGYYIDIHIENES